MDCKEMVIANDYVVGMEEDGSGVRVTLEVDGLPKVRIPGDMLERIITSSAKLIMLYTLIDRVTDALDLDDIHDCANCHVYDECDLSIKEERGVTIECYCPDDE